MCGRFAQAQSIPMSAHEAGIALDPSLFDGSEAGPRYNVPPGSRAWIFALNADGAPIAEHAMWRFMTPRGLRINARSETAARVPEYREHFARHRIAVPVSGFYEPEGAKTAKNRPWWYFQPTVGTTLFLGGFAGPEGFTLLTRAPIPPVGDVHDRTPIFVPPDRVLDWLNPEISGKDALALAPVEFGATLDAWRVGDGAKKPGNEGPELIRPLMSDSLF